MGKIGCVGVRREDMYRWERRTPLVPEDARTLSQATGVPFHVQSSPTRAYTEDEYRTHGIPVLDSLQDCPLIFGLKEIPLEVLERGKAYVFFSHVIKGQPQNMPMLQRALDLGCTIIDYERIVDDQGRRQIAFGNYAGLAGMIDSLWSLGRRLAWEGMETPFQSIQQASRYTDLTEAKEALRTVEERILSEGLPEALTPCIVGIAGYGNVSKGAQEILRLLPIQSIDPSDLLANRLPDDPRHTLFQVVFKENDTVLPLVERKPFELQEFYEHPERYRAAFERYLPHLTVLVNCIYWEPKYPRLVTREAARRLYENGQPRLRVVGDITCDVEGSVEITLQATEPDNPVYVYDPVADSVSYGVEGNGPVVLAVEILPSELPREASAYFSRVLKRFVPELVAAEYDVDLDELCLSPPLKRAVICHRGRLAPEYEYLEEPLATAPSRE